MITENKMITTATTTKMMTYRMANLRGCKDRAGKRKKQMLKHANAPRLHPVKTRMRSHRLTVRAVRT